MLTIVLATTLLVLFLFHLYKTTYRHRLKYADIPAVGWRWPVVGNLFDMSRTHLVLTDWYEKYGSVFRFSLYGEEIVVLSSYESIFEALVTRGSDFAGRPHMTRTDYQDRNRNSIVWQTYTPKLQFLRKQIHASLRMYGNGLDRLEARCGTEIEVLVARIEAAPNLTFDPWSLLYDSACNIMLDLALGLRLPHEGPGLNRLKEINGLFNHSFGPGSSRILDQFPALNFLRDEFRALKTAVDLRNQFWADHQHNCDSAHESAKTDNCVVRDLQRLARDPNNSEFDISEDTLKETFTNLILAGTDTTTTAVTCLLLVLLHKPEIQHRLHEELDHVVGGARAPSLGDREHMPYTEACLYETLRYISHVPLAVPHATICDTLHHDKTVWGDPWNFRPERFLTDSGRLVPAHHYCRKRLLAFGAGRRVCLGETLAKNRLYLFTTALLQRYHFRSEGSPPPLDPKSFTLGIVLHPGQFRIQAIPRTTGDHITENTNDHIDTGASMSLNR
ncbi:CP1A1-like protein [Mya arenaria]|uniref:CP1A1-like protein n=1 Tax=Mya arenaria TaxID=6604 RepID=A0ABY7ETS9_MYAAR|nr:CP1A1-like protein [Mya arenaria]